MTQKCPTCGGELDDLDGPDPEDAWHCSRCNLDWTEAELNMQEADE